MTKKMKRFMFTAIAVGLLAGCYPAGPEYVEDLDVVFTTFDEAYDFQSKNTFAMPDQIVVDYDEDDGPVYMLPIFADPLLAKIRSNMEDLGWEYAEIDQDPDVLLTPAGISSTTYYYSYWYDWWYGGYYGGWGWYYPPSYSVSSYTTGSLILVIADPDTSGLPINQSQTAWIGAMNGLLTGAYDVTRALDGIDQAFEQSPYLKIN
jgi:Domain of unknown function (DUF4136)